MEATASKTRQRVVSMCLAALFAAVYAVCAWISIPMPSGISFTLQTFGVALGGYLLGASWGTASIAVYLCIGAIGLPVFSGFGGGAAKLIGVTGGYLIGFIGMAALCGWARRFKNIFARLGLGFAGLTVCHLLGILQFSHISGNGFLASAAIGTVPYIVKDLISLVAASLLASVLLERTPIKRYFQ